MVMQAVLPSNPFGSSQALANSSYGAFRDGKLVRPLGGTPSGVEEFVHDSFRALVLNQRFACVAAKSAIHLGNYRIGNYAEMGAQPSMDGVAHDLYEFVQEQPWFDGFSTFVATFNAPATGDELAFERRLWASLQRLHLIDHAHHGWDPSVSSDPDSKDFSFSFAGRAFFLVGLHPGPRGREGMALPLPPRERPDAMSTTPTPRRIHIPPQTGTGFELTKGDVLRITDPTGEQVSDLMAFAKNDLKKVLSSGRSIDYANTIYLTTGHVLYSNDSEPMFTILEDRVGRHDFLLTPCSQETFSIIYKNDAPHPSCFGNLVENLEQFGIKPHQIPTTFNVFMNVLVDPAKGELTIGPPRSKAGDYTEFRAEMDLFVGVTACSAEMSNNYSVKPIDIAIYV